MRFTLAVSGFLALLAGCGDNSKQCGPGTVERDGVCEPAPGDGLLCGDGTVHDKLTNECVPSPDVCSGGTVLIDGQCVDPSSGLTIDLEEGPEPNGFEPDASLAGTITLKPDGEGFVLHGCVAPVGETPDLDVYAIDVTGPTLIEVTADGVEGLDAGFIMFGDAPQLADWFRLGINVATDTSKRQVFLPTAGRYELVMTDTRTLLPITQNGEGFPAAGNSDGTSCYYVTVTQRQIPAPEPLNLATGKTGLYGTDIKFFTAPFPTGFTSLTAVIDPEGPGTLDSRAASSLVLMNNNKLRQINDAGNGFPANSPVSAAIFGGIKAGDVPLLVLDHVWNYKLGPADFAIDVEAAITSQPLPTDGSSINATSNGQAFLGPDGGFDKVNMFHFDVTASGQIHGMDITFSIPVQGSLIDQDARFASTFTGITSEINGQPSIHTFTSYKGSIRSLAPGRYYFFLFTPRNAPNTPFTVTSLIEKQLPDALLLDTPNGFLPFNAFNSYVATYDVGTEPWHLLTGTTTQGGGNLAISVFDPAVTERGPGFAFGRLDPMITKVNELPPTPLAGDGIPLFAGELAGDGSTPVPAIFKNPFATAPAFASPVLITTRSSLESPSGTFEIELETRAYDNFGGATIAAGETRNAGGAIDGGADRYYFETTPGNQVTITVTPTGNFDPVLATLDTTEGPTTTTDFQGDGGTEVVTFTQGASGFTAFQITGHNAGSYTVQVQVTAGAYSIVATSNTTFDNACVGGGVALPLVADENGFLATDDGFSAELATPAGFTFFGQPAGNSFKVSTNGFLTFNTSLASSGGFDGNVPLSSTADHHIAPFWDDLDNVTICRKDANGKTVIQWSGQDFSSPVPRLVQFQAILDPSDDSIEFVYGPFHSLNGVGDFDFGATVGIENLDGSSFVEIGFDQPVVTPNLSIKLTPN